MVKSMGIVELVYERFGAYPTPSWALVAAGIFVLTSLSLSMFLIFEHLSSYKNPEVLGLKFVLVLE